MLRYLDKVEVDKGERVTTFYSKKHPMLPFTLIKMYQVDTQTKLPLKSLYIHEMNGVKDNCEYVRFKYDSRGNMIYFYHWQKAAYHFTKTGEVTVVIKIKEFHFEHDDNGIKYYRDNEGNEWKKEWGIPNPFKIKLESYANAMYKVSGEIKRIELDYEDKIKEQRELFEMIGDYFDNKKPKSTPNWYLKYMENERYGR